MRVHVSLGHFGTGGLYDVTAGGAGRPGSLHVLFVDAGAHLAGPVVELFREGYFWSVLKLAFE